MLFVQTQGNISEVVFLLPITLAEDKFVQSIVLKQSFLINRGVNIVEIFLIGKIPESGHWDLQVCKTLNF